MSLERGSEALYSATVSSNSAWEHFLLTTSNHCPHTFISNLLVVWGATVMMELTGMLPHISLLTSCHIQEGMLYFGLILFSYHFDTFCPLLCTFSMHWWNNGLKTASHCDMTAYYMSSSGLCNPVLHSYQGAHPRITISTRSLWLHGSTEGLEF